MADSPEPEPRRAWQMAGRSGVAWPTVPPAPDAVVVAVLAQLNQSEFWSAGALRKHQLRQLEQLLRFVSRSVPFYAPRLEALQGLRGGELTLEAFGNVPLLTHRDIQYAGEALFCTSLPLDHGRTVFVHTSGSTGSPVRVQSTDVTALMNAALAARYHQWHRRDPKATMAGLVTVREKEGTRAERWIPGFQSTPTERADTRRAVEEQIAWLRERQPAYLLVHPTNLDSLLRHGREVGFRPEGLRGVLTLGEVLEPDVRAACTETWGVAPTDSYSCKEVGMIACQCPQQEHYHVQSENLLVEVLDENGAQCAPGMTGRIVLTDLHNFASPLIRYEIGDYAEVGETYPGGRGLPVLTRILGRTRNMLRLPDGGEMWPRLGTRKIAKIPAVRQIQVVQPALERLVVRYVAAGVLPAEDETALREAVAAAVPVAMEIELEAVEEIPRSASGKFEEFLCEVEAPAD